MEYRPLELTVVSAKDIQNVNLFGKMDVYVVVTLGFDPRTKQKTPIDKDGGTKPKWNFQMKFQIDEAAAQNGGLVLIFQLKCTRSIGGDKDIGEVHVPVKELLDNAESGKSPQFVSYQVRKASGKSKGQLNFSYMFGDKVSAPSPTVSKGDEPVTAYPAAGGSNAVYPSPWGGYPPGAMGPPPPPQAGYGYPPAAPGYGYPPQGFYHQPPPPPGYGYPPPQGYGGHPPPQGYGHPPMQQQHPPMQQQHPPKKKKNKFGMGLGAGLLGGALGGMLIGDMVSDMASVDMPDMPDVPDVSVDDAVGYALGF